MSEVLEEITPLSEKDCFYIVDRHKTEFTYPLHQHREYELNFIENAAGVKRIVGDSVEEIVDYDLVLICSENLEHAWDNGRCSSGDIREVTIQFSPDLLSGSLMMKNQFAPIMKMFRDADHGVAFSRHTIMKVYSMIDGLASVQEGFMRFLKFLKRVNLAVVLLALVAAGGACQELSLGESVLLVTLRLCVDLGVCGFGAD